VVRPAPIRLPAACRAAQPNVPFEPRRRRGRVRRVLRLRTARIILALVVVLCCWLAFSVGQALTAPGGGSLSSKLAEWARDHYLGPVVTFGEWLTYSPPKVGGKPAFSLAVPKGAQATARPRARHVSAFKPTIPARLNSPAGRPLPGEGVWRVLETVHGEPAMFGTYLRPSPAEAGARRPRLADRGPEPGRRRAHRAAAAVRRGHRRALPAAGHVLRLAGGGPARAGPG
jgi:hypothetical protein